MCTFNSFSVANFGAIGKSIGSVAPSAKPTILQRRTKTQLRSMPRSHAILTLL